ncbi:MAG: hypothetical protein IJS32_01860 [Kiritimatiellae bacterium]|nr:hypothetical protein [Kiritimatiellia bacterium]
MKRERTGIAARGGTVAVGVLAQCGLWAALAGMGMAWSATVVRFSPWGGGWGTEACRVWGWALLYAVLATALAWLLRMLSRHMRPACFLLACMGISLAGQAVLIGLSGSGWRPTNDAAIFTRYLDHLAANGSGPEALGALSDQYDYRVWTRRAHPFYLPLRKAAGADFGRAVQMVQAVLSVLPMLFVWRMLAVLFGRKTAVWATVFQTVFPFRWIACLELNHHLPGGLLFSAALWVLVEFFRVGHGRTGRLALFAAACLLLPLMELEGGIDWVYGVSVLAVCMGLAVAGRLKIRDAAVALAGLWLVPLLVARMAVGPLLARIDAADLHHLESGAVAFMARGWVPETGGEYAYSHEIIDCLTPLELKTGVQKRLLLSQLAYNAPEVLFRLFPVKLAKYFLLGFAAGAEEMLVANGAENWAAAAKGARVVFLLAFLPLAALGGLRWMPRAAKSRNWPFLMPCVLLAAAYVCTGETSPRYSIYIQALLFALAGFGVSRSEAGWPVGWARHSLPATGVLAAAFAVLAVPVLFLVPPLLKPFACMDMRALNGEGDVFARPEQAARQPFAVELLPVPTSGGTAWGPLVLPADSQGTRDAVVYVFPGEGGNPLRQNTVEWIWETGEVRETGTIIPPACLRLAGAGRTGGRLGLHVPFACNARVEVGYAFWTPPESAAGERSPIGEEATP